MINDFCNKIKGALERSYYIGFDVERIFDQNEKYKIIPNKSYNNTFVLNVTIRDETRLIITCEPDKYGKLFLENINLSNSEKRNVFCDYWQLLGVNTLKVVINNSDCTMQDFMNNRDEWHNFLIRYSKAPFYENEIEEKEKNIIDAILWICGMILSITDYSIEGLEEGNPTVIASKKYERNPVNRKLCLAVKGYNCSVCGLNFEKKYGEIGKDFIHVHHAIPLHLIGEEYKVDPIKDLYPVCPNCHNMLHRIDPPYSIEQLKEILQKNNI